MKKALLLLFLLTVSLAALVESVEARGWGRRRGTYYTTYSSNTGGAWNGPVAINEADQAACEQEASYMASNYIYGHVWGTIGAFEGWGCGVTTGCATCIPGWNATLTGDAVYVSATGEHFRVRSWR